MSDSSISLPNRMSLVVNNYIPPYTFSEGSNMLRINGSGLISGYGPNGSVGASEVTQVLFDGEFELDIDIKENLSKTLKFTGVTFNGEIDVRLFSLKTVHFVNCHFSDNAILRISGVAESISFLGCSLSDGSTIDLRELCLDTKMCIADCMSIGSTVEGDNCGGFLVPENSEADEVGWKLPAIAIAAAGLLSVIGAAKKKKRALQINKAQVELEQK